MGVPTANVSMTGFEICTLLMCVVSGKIVDKYNYLHNSVPTDLKKMVKELTKMENKPKITSKSASDLRERSQAGLPNEGRTPKEKRHKSVAVRG